MNNFIRLAKPNLLAQIRPVKKAFLSTSQVRYDADDPMLQLGPYPRTKEERIRAAKKYNLIPEDYEPYEEGEGWGDYPKLKPVGEYNRDPYDDFDDPQGRRFYGEPYHLDDDLYKWERIDPYAEEKEQVPRWKQLGFLLIMVWTIPFIYTVCRRYNIQVNHPWKKRIMHHPNQEYYHFPKSETSTSASHH